MLMRGRSRKEGPELIAVIAIAHCFNGLFAWKGLGPLDKPEGRMPIPREQNVVFVQFANSQNADQS